MSRPGTCPRADRHGADKVLLVSDPALSNYQPEIYKRLLADLVDQYRPEILLVPATHWAATSRPRLAQCLDTGLISHCVKLELDMAERLLLGTFPILDGEMYPHRRLPQRPPPDRHPAARLLSRPLCGRLPLRRH